MNGQDEKNLDLGNSVKAAAQEAQGVIAETAETVKNVAANAAARGQEFAREAGQQASAAAATAYGASNEFLDVVEGAIRQNPWSALLIAGAAGYGLACLVKHSR